MKRLLALLLAIVLTVSCVPLTPAHAHEAEESHEHDPDTVIAETQPEETLPGEVSVEKAPADQTVSSPRLITIPMETIRSTGSDPDDLFARYVDSVFYPSDAKALGTEAGDRLSGDLRKLYDGICWLFKEVASGRRTSTEIYIGEGQEYDVPLSGNSPSDEEITILMSAFLSDLAYEQYWFDKTSGFWYGGGSSFYFGFIVAENYRGADEFHTNAAITGAATQSAANARQIVANFAGKSDYEKLVQYSDTLCDLVEYDYDAANVGNFAQCNDPWQMIYAFDYDPTTNIVCEGYAKSYKYLCDQSSFEGDITCYTVTGDTGGPHMWNIVSIGNRNFLTDITNVDGGWNLLLAGGSGSITGGYTVSGLGYTYDSETKNLWGTGSDSILTLASTHYKPSCTGSHTPGAEATCTEPQTCVNCGAELAPAKGHTPGAEPTCTEAQTCTVCGDQVSPALGHAWVKESEQDGVALYRCSRCGTTKSETVPGTPDPDDGAWPFAEEEWEVLRLVNKERTAEGLAPLTGFSLLQQATGVRSDELITLFDHTRPDGTPCYTALDELDISYWSAGENIAAGYPTPAAVMDGWMNSSGHRANILNANFQHLGVGYSFDASADYRHYWAQLFTGMNSVNNNAFLLVCPEGTEFATGTTIDEMGIFVQMTNSAYGTCYLPIIAEFCTGYDPASEENQAVTLSVLGYTKTFDISRPPHTHTYGDWYETLAPTCTEPGQERRDCAECGASEVREVAAAGHKPGAEATCTEPQVCTVCSLTLAPAKGHTPGAEPTCEEGQYCTVCGTELQPALEHIPGSAPTCTTAQTCTRCGEELQPALGHIPVAVPGREPTCTQPGFTDCTSCSRCGMLLTPQETIPAKGHTPNIPAPTCTESQVCVDCYIELSPPVPHTPGAAPTCTEPQLCTVCGTELAPAAGHTPGPDATCTDPQSCTVCGAELAPSKGHTPGAAPTCTEAQVCTVCGIQIAPAKGHTEKVIPAVDPTCTEPGLSEGKQCAVCGIILTPQQTVPAAGHIPGPGPSVGEPQRCTVCGIILQPALPSLADCSMSVAESAVYTGEPITLTVKITSPEGQLLEENIHYTLSYENNINIGIGVVHANGIGTYGGSYSAEFTIVPAQVQNLHLEDRTSTTAKIKFDAVPGAGTYRISVDGKVKGSTESTSYTVKGLKLGQEYKITVEAGKKSGDTTYYGKASEGLIVVPSSSLSGYKVSLQYSSTIHDGSAKMPTVKVTKDKKALVQDRDYTVSYDNNIAVGKATVTVTGMGSYNGTLTKTFTINPGKVTGLTCEAAGPTSLAISFDAVPGAKFYKVYAGGKLKATVSETTCVLTELKAGTTYKITVKAGAEAGGTEFLGSASAAVSGKPAYDITKCNASLAYESVAYNGKTRKPAVTVLSETGSKLKKDTHYTVSYKANKAVGLATVTVKGKGAYTGTVTLTFEIVPGKVSTPTFSSVTGNSAVVKWKKASGAAWYRIWVNGEPLDITSSLSYTLTGLEAGRTYTIEVHGGKTVGDEDYCGVLAKAELTPTWDLSKYTVKLDSDKVTYTGEAVVPAVTVTDENGNVLKLDEDFTVSCKNNTKIGKASLTVKGTGKYRGSITKSFQIVPAQVQNIQVTSVTKKSLKISFDKVPSASTYRIYVNGKLKGTTSKTSFTIQKLKAGTEYQITVQAGKKVGKTTFYGAMSDIFTAATKP